MFPPRPPAQSLYPRYKVGYESASRDWPMGLAQGIDIEDGKQNSPRRAWYVPQREGGCATQSTVLKSELVRYGQHVP